MEFQTIGEQDLWRMLRRNDVYVIDLRSNEAFRRFHIRGAKNLPYDEMAVWKNRLPRNRKLILYCERGSTSMMAAKRLWELGYEVYTLVGGISALNE